MRLSEKQRNEPPVKLTRAEKREIQAIIRKYKGDGKAHSAQASIPYQAMYPDGICRVTANTFSKCIEFSDISYQLAQADTKTAIFENLCDLYNYLDASIHVQLSFVNRKIDPKQYAKSFEIKAQGDDFDDIRAEYSGILQDQLVRGNNGLTKRKFLTFTIEADNLKMARARLTRIETDLLGYCDSFGFTPVPEFFLQREKQLTPRELLTGESIQTPRGSFLVTDMSREQLEAAGYGFHHQSEDGKYLIMGNGTDAFAIPAQQESPIKAAEMTTEQNYNMIDGVLNNAPTMSELEAKAKAGEQISLFDVAEAAKAEARKPKQPQRPAQKQKKPSIRAQLKAAKEEQQKKPPQREKTQELEV